MFRHLLGRRHLWIVRGKRGKRLDEYSFLTTFIIVRRSHEFFCCSWRHMRGCKLGRATLFVFVLSHYTLLCPSMQCLFAIEVGFMLTTISYSLTLLMLLWLGLIPWSGNQIMRELLFTPLNLHTHSTFFVHLIPPIRIPIPI